MPKPWAGQIRAHSTFVLTSCCLAVFTDIFFYGVLPPILPYALVERAHVGSDQLQTWVAVIPAVYCASLVLTSPLAGFLSDHMSRRQPLFLTAVLFQFAGISMLMVGSSIALWIAGVAVAGCSSSIVWASSLALVLDSTSREHVGQQMSYIGMSISTGIMLGPLLGGIVYGTGGSYAVWGMCLGLIGMDLVVRIVMIEPRQSSTWILPSDQSISEHGEARLEKGMLENVKQETPNRRPAILTLGKSPRFAFALFATLLFVIAITSIDGALPIYVKETFGFSSLGTGLLYLALTIPGFLQPFIGYLVDRHGGRLIGTLGFAFAVPAFTCLRFVDHNSLNQKVLLAALLTIIGVCAAAVLPVLMAEASYVVLEHESLRPGSCGQKGAFAQAHSLWTAAYSVGCTVGPIWGGEIQKAAGWKTESWTVALLCALAAFLTPIFVGHGVSAIESDQGH